MRAQKSREQKLAIGLNGREVYIPQPYHWGQEAREDWYAFGVTSEGDGGAV